MKELSSIYPDPPAGLDPAKLDLARIPQHVAIIMDGNGRWAKRRGLKRLNGHRAGVEAVREAVRMASDLGIRYLTIYSFSSENWKRPHDEVVGLMDLFAKTMLVEAEGLNEENVRIMTIGRTEALPEKTRAAFDEAWNITKDNTGMTLIGALNYGGRQEIVDAVNAAVAAGDPVDESSFSRLLSTADIPDPELLIRTSGEMRISNFLLWQIAYSELVVTDVLWPDFNRYEFLRALLEYQGRNRRFGGV